MSLQKSFEDLQLVGEFIIAGKDPQTTHIAIVTDRDGMYPVITNMPLASAVAFVRDAIGKNQETIDGKGADANDQAIARNRLPALKTSLRHLENLGPL